MQNKNDSQLYDSILVSERDKSNLYREK